MRALGEMTQILKTKRKNLPLEEEERKKQGKVGVVESMSRNAWTLEMDLFLLHEMNMLLLAEDLV